MSDQIPAWLTKAEHPEQDPPVDDLTGNPLEEEQAAVQEMETPNPKP